MDKETLKKLQKDLPKKAITARGVAKGFDGKGDIVLVGYKWQHVVIHLNDILDGQWDFKIKKYSIEHNCVFVHCALTIEGVTREQIGGSEYTEEDKLSNVIKAAVDDCFGRCCAFFEIGMKAYLGEEKRKTFDPNNFKKDEDRNFKTELIAYCEKRKITARTLQESLLANGYTQSFATTSEDYDEINKLIDLVNISEEESKNIVKFIRDTQASKILNLIKESIPMYIPKSDDYSRVKVCIANYGADVVQQSIKDFIKATKAPDLVEGSKSHMWNYITTICKTNMDRMGKTNVKKKKKVEKIMSKCGTSKAGNLMGSGDKAAFKEDNPY